MALEFTMNCLTSSRRPHLGDVSSTPKQRTWGGAPGGMPSCASSTPGGPRSPGLLTTTRTRQTSRLDGTRPVRLRSSRSCVSRGRSGPPPVEPAAVLAVSERASGSSQRTRQRFPGCSYSLATIR